MIILSPSQQKACDAFRLFLRDPNKYEFLLAGYAGTGKSFLVTYLLDLVRDEHKLVKLISPRTPAPNFHFTATTNKAAHVLAGMVGEPAKTVHAALGLAVQTNYNTGEAMLVQKNDCTPLNYSVLIVDEASMVDTYLLQHIQKARRKHKECKVLYVGDSYQLPPVEENVCPIFHKIEEIYFLTDIQRQAADSPIISFSHKYREMLDDPELPWPEIPNNGQSILHYTDPTVWKDAIKKAYLEDHEPDDLRVLSWSNDRSRGYNQWIRKQLGYTEPFVAGETVISNSVIMINDRVRASTDSLHTIMEVEKTIDEGLEGYCLTVYGRTGDRIKVFQPADWTQANKLLTLLSKAAKQTDNRDERNDLWKRFWNIKNGWADFRSVHSQTVHKSQGSTYREVFIDVSDIAQNNKWWEVARLMYVAITRASTRVHLFGQIAERYNRKDPMASLRKFQNGQDKPTYT